MTRDEIFEVLDPGLLTTVQDAGRPGLGSLGVPRSGAADPNALAVANVLLGNRADAPALEATLVGPRLRALRDTVIGIAGGDLGTTLEPAGRRLAVGAAHPLRVGEEVAMAGASTTDAGCRAYLAVPGGVAVPIVLGSASTSLVGGFGGMAGRPLRAGDRLVAGDGGMDAVRLAALARRRWPTDLALPHPDDPVDVVAGPAALTATGRGALDRLVSGEWRVASASDRRGLRLEGPELQVDVAADGPSHGVPTGTIQVTPSGQPLVLLPDAGPTGGYPVLAVVTTAALSVIGQVRPGGRIRFRLVDLETARAAERERRHRLASGAERLAAWDPWDDLPDHAGA